MENLITLLEQAEELASQFTGGYSNRFSSAEEFHQALKIAIVKLRQGDTEVLNDLWLWFAPTCDWDDLIGMEGVNLGNDVHEEISKLVK